MCMFEEAVYRLTQNLTFLQNSKKVSTSIKIS